MKWLNIPLIAGNETKMEQSLNSLMEIPEARWVVAGTLLIFIILLSVYIAFFFRNLAIGGSDEDPTDLLSGFRQMRDDGQLDEKEYTRLKQVLPGERGGLGGLAEQNSVPVNEMEKTAKTEEAEKKFLTLAEAQQLKQDAAKLDEVSSSDQVDESE